MCGITGWIDWEHDLTEQCRVLEAMTATLEPRGPDAVGRWLSPNAALGHRRLAVIDPAGGGQPMIRRRGNSSCVLVYNGELYNTNELRTSLENLGYTFHGHSDTEVLLVSYIEWGQNCVHRFNGIYAFAVWDEAAGRLFMARDRLGVKPLFYTKVGSALLFASELKSLLAHPAVRPVVGAEGLAEVFALGPARTPGHGVYKGISELRPGYSLIYDREGLRIRQYWGLESKPHEDNLDQTVLAVRNLLQDTIERQLVADVPVCTLLSGGLDSSAITAFANSAFRRNGMEPIHTFSVDYLDNDRHFVASDFQPNSDSVWVPIVSEYLGTQHHSVVIDTPELVESLATAVLARDLPGMADVDSSLYLFCREIKKAATVALSGECADEIFGGYPWFHSKEALEADTFPWSRNIDTRLSFLSPELINYIRPEQYLARRYQETVAETPLLPGENAVDSQMRKMFYLNINWFMANLLDRKDRMSMATGLEVRVPFADHRLVEYVWNIPWAMKTCDGMRKGVLRRALADLLPEPVVTRQKSPYPKTHHPAYLAAVRERLSAILDDQNAPLLPLINRKEVRELINSRQHAFSKPFFGQLMTDAQLFAYLIQVNTWLTEYKVEIC